jgi:hypothetical protein
MLRGISDYVESCPACQLGKPKRHLPFGELAPITSPSEPFAVLSIDFIVALPETPDKMNCLLTVTDKFTKYVRLIPGREQDAATAWARRFFDEIFRFWGMPTRIISDRDPKFTSTFWKCLFRQCRTDLCMTTAYHPSADGQAERTNQTVETALRCLLVGEHVETWSQRLPEVEYALNTAKNRSTGETPFKLLYGTDHHGLLEPPRRDDTEQNPGANAFIDSRLRIRKDVSDALTLAQSRMALQFDRNHQPATLIGKVFIKVTKGIRPGYKLPGSTTLDTIKIGPFRILEQVGKLAYRLDLPATMKIHPVISIVHLEQSYDDPYNRLVPEPGPIMVDGQPMEVIRKILRKEHRGKKNVWYKVRWKDQANTETWEPRDQLLQDVPAMLEKFERSRQ